MSFSLSISPVTMIFAPNLQGELVLTFQLTPLNTFLTPRSNTSPLFRGNCSKVLRVVASLTVRISSFSSVVPLLTCLSIHDGTWPDGITALTAKQVLRRHYNVAATFFMGIPGSMRWEGPVIGRKSINSVSCYAPSFFSPADLTLCH